MVMRLMVLLRCLLGFTQQRLEREAKVDRSYISKAEGWGYRLGDDQLERLAKVLGWEGDPKLLLKFVDRDELMRLLMAVTA